MKKFLLSVMMMISGFMFAQDNNPELEAEGQLVKATYYYNNGSIQQVGYFKEGKLDGKWISYDVNGKISAVAEYTNGIKSGKWLYYSDSICTSEVDFSNNSIVAVKKFNKNSIAVKD